MTEALGAAGRVARSGWRVGIERRPRLVAAGSGLACALALPPVGLWPLLLALTPLLHVVLRARSVLAAFGLGWLFGLVYFLAGLYWIGIAFFTDAERFGLFAIPAVVALCALLALSPGVAAGLVRARSWRTPAAAALAFSLAFTALEWVRGHIGGGFPWNLIGYAWTDTPVIQATAVVGIYGLSLLTLVAATLPLALLARGGRAGLGSAALAALLIAGLFAGGAWRLAGGEVPIDSRTRIRLVQANVSQFDKWQDADQETWFRRHLALSTSPGEVDHVVWPESATPYALARDAVARRVIADVAPEDGYVLTGGNRYALDQEPPKVWNSLFVLNGGGELAEVYDKRLLVPFGEFVPLRWLFGTLGLAKLTQGSVDFWPGPGPRTLSLPGLPPFSPLICYEAIFSGDVVNRAAPRPAWLLNITNDAWFGHSSGPYQHLAMARVRSIEEGLPLLRAANTGISAVIDPYGRILDRLPLDTSGVLDTGLPAPLPDTTPFVHLGPFALLALLGGVLVVSVVLEFRAPVPKD